MSGEPMLVSMEDGTLPHVPEIYTLLSKVMGEISAVGKDSKAPQAIGGYKFRGIDAVMTALQPALVKHGVSVVPEVQNITHSEYQVREGKMQHYIVTVRYTFYAPDGSHISTTVYGEGADKGDKGVNKAMAGAMKYAITQALCIPTQEQKDAEHDDTDLSGGRSSKEPPPKPARTPAVEGLLEQAKQCSLIEELQSLAKDIPGLGLTEVELVDLRGEWGSIQHKLEQEKQQLEGSSSDAPY